MSGDIVFGIRFTADGKEVAGTARAQADEFRKLGEAIQRSNQQGKTAADQFTASLKRQADTLGMTRTQTMAYEASQHQLTTAQRQQVAESIRAIDAHEKQERMLGRVKTAAAAAGAALVAALSAGLKASVAAAIESEQAQLRLEAVLKATGYAAGFNGRELEKMASGMQRRLGIDDETVKKSMAVLLTFRSVQRESFGEALEVAANLSKVMGTDLQSAVMQLGKALENPEQGLTALTRSGVTFDAAQKSMIENLAATGRQAEAITLILKIMKEQGLDKVAEAMNQGLFKATNALKNEWNDLLETLGQTAVVKAPVEGALGSIEEKLRALRNLVEGDWVDRFVIIGSFIQPSPDLGAMMRGVVARKRNAIDDAPVREGGLERYAINLGIERQRRDRARGQVQEYLQQFQSDNEKLALELKKFRDLGQQAELSAAALLDGEARIRAKFAKKEKKPFDYVGNVFADVSDDLNKMAARLLKEEETAVKAAADAIDHRTAVQQQAEAAQADFNRTQSETLKQIEDETQLLGLNEREREKAIALRKLENEYDKASVKLKEEDTDAWERRTAAMRRDYEQRKAELPAAIDRRADARDIQKQIEEGRDAAKRMNEDLQRGLTDSIFRGFEAGKSFARNFRDSLVNMFKTTILRPVIQWVVSPITGAITGAVGGLGIPGLANAAGGGSSALGALGNLSSLGGISDMFGGLVGGANAVFQNLGVGMGSQLLADIGNFGFGVPVLGGLTNLLMGNTRGAIGSTALGIAGTMIGGPVGGAIGSMVGSLFGGSSKISTQSLGGLSRSYDSSGNILGEQASFGGATPYAAGQVSRLYQSYDALVKSLGGSYDAVNFGFGANTGRQSQNPQFAISGTINGKTFGNPGVETPLNDANLQIAASRAILQALQSTQLPEFIQKYIGALTPESMDQAAIDNALGFAASIKQLHEALGETRAPMEIAKDQAVSLFTELTTSADRFRQDFRAAIEAGISQESLARWQQLGALLDQINQVNAQIVSGYQGAQLSIRSSLRSLQEQAPGVNLVDLWQTRLDKRLATLDAVSGDDDKIRMAGMVQEAIMARYQAEVDAINQAADAVARMREQAISLNQYVKALKVSDLSTLSPEAQLEFAGQQFFNAVNRVRAGDQTAYELLQPRAQSYLQEARGYYASGSGYTTTFDTVSTVLDQLAKQGISLNPETDRTAQLITAQQEATNALNSLYTALEGQVKRVRSFDVGTAFVPHDMQANIHAGEMVIDPETSAGLRRYGIRVDGGSKEVVAELRALVRLQSAANRELVEKMSAVEKRLAGIESKARLQAAA